MPNARELDNMFREMFNFNESSESTADASVNVKNESSEGIINTKNNSTKNKELEFEIFN